MTQTLLHRIELATLCQEMRKVDVGRMHTSSCKRLLLLQPYNKRRKTSCIVISEMRENDNVI